MKLWALAVKSTNSPLPVEKWVFWHPAIQPYLFLIPTHATSFLLTGFWIAAPFPLPHCEASGRLWSAEAQLSCWDSAVAPSGAAPSSMLSSLHWFLWQWPPHLSNNRKRESTSSTKIMLIGVKGCKTWIGMVLFAGGTKLCFSIKLGKSIKIAGK